MPGVDLDAAETERLGLRGCSGVRRGQGCDVGRLECMASKAVDVQGGWTRGQRDRAVSKGACMWSA